MSLDAEPFTLKGDRRAVLCIHGFTGTPFEVKPVARRLHQEGATVRAMRLPGHGTSLADLDRTTWSDWTGAVTREFEALRAEHGDVFVVGQSLGGLLTLHLARHSPDGLSGIAVLATPLWLFELPTRFVATARRFPMLFDVVKKLPKLGGADVRDQVMKARIPSYPAIPTRALLEFADFMNLVRRELPEVSAPTLVMHAHDDHTAPFACMQEVASRISSKRVETVALKESFHLIAIDVERHLVGEKVAAFALSLPAWAPK